MGQENTEVAQSSPPTSPKTAPGAGPMVGIIIVILLLAAGGYYFLQESGQNEVSEVPYIPGDEVSESWQAESTGSDEAAAIEAELEATNMNEFEAAMESDLEATNSSL